MNFYDIRRGEMVNGFIIDSTHAEASIDQVDRLKKAEPKFNSSSKQPEFKKKIFANQSDDRATYVDVSSIKSSRPASDFNAKEIEDLADSMIANGGLLRPMILGMTGPEEHQVIDGHLAYNAAVRAKQKDIRRGEMVNGFVISPDNINNVIKQLKLGK